MSKSAVLISDGAGAYRVFAGQENWPAAIAAAVAAGWTILALALGARMKSWTGDDARSSRPLQQRR